MTSYRFGKVDSELSKIYSCESFNKKKKKGNNSNGCSLLCISQSGELEEIISLKGFIDSYYLSKENIISSCTRTS